MGQLFCKDCSDRFKKSAVVHECEDEDDDRGTYSTSAGSSQKSIPSSGDLLERQRSRIKHKKRRVALHAEFRDRQGILAPPLVTERLMEDTDNVFSGQRLGVETVPVHKDRIRPIKFEKPQDEDDFLDKALRDDGNFIFDGLTDELRQSLKDYLERISVPRSTLLIRKGDEPDYLYLILDGEVAVYIDPNEYVYENSVTIDISLRSKSLDSISSPLSVRSEPFKQSYVLQLRKSMFGSSHKENTPRDKNDGIVGVGQLLSLARESWSGSHTSVLTGIMEDVKSGASEEDTVVSLVQFNELLGLKHERDLGNGDVFGELGLIYNCPRTACCLTTTDCVLYRVSGDIFRSILASSNSDRAKKRCTESKVALETLFNMGVVEELDEQTLQDLQEAMNPITFDQADLVITKGAHDDMMFFVMSGKLFAHDIGTGDSRKADIELGAGGHFGELNLLTGRPSIANVTVLTQKARLMAVTKNDYKKRKSLEPLMQRLWRRTSLLTIPLIAKSKLLPLEINRLVHKLERVSFSRGKLDFLGEMKQALYIVDAGKVQLTVTDVDGVVNSFDQHDHFGGRSLFDGNFFERKSVQVRAVLPTECTMLTLSAIVEVIGQVNRLGKPSLPVSRKLMKNMKLSDLTLHKIIGVGMFGRVWLVESKMSTVYALKVMEKQDIMGKKMVKGVMREKNVMASVEHPFISNLVSTFQDKHSLFMLMSYIQGGELFGLIYNVSKKGYLSNDAAAFYGACIAEALSHLHSRSICHRDLKPENILINAAGYVVLVDFGFAKVVLDKTFTTCGSPEYMAPEILLGKGHSVSVDHWALGAVLYEMLVGQTPFIHVGATRMTLFRRICNGTFAFPNSEKHGINVSDPAKSLIRGLLNKSPGERIGASPTFGDEEILTDPFFQGLLTEYKNAFLSEKVTPPWLPDIGSELDASYFGSHDSIEKEVLSKKKVTLDKKSQDLFEGF